jgi:hypothetical protein
VLAASPRAASAQDEATFLDLAMDARSVALGGRSLALEPDATSVFANPGSLPWIHGLAVSATQSLWSETSGLRAGSIAAARSRGEEFTTPESRRGPSEFGYGIAVAYQGLDVGAGERWTEISIQAAFGAAVTNFAAFGLAFRHGIAPSRFDGTTGASADFLDAGGRAILTSRLTGALRVENLVSSSRWKGGDAHVPERRILLALALDRRTPVRAEARFVFHGDGWDRLQGGVETVPLREALVLRAGFSRLRAAESRSAWSLGAGIRRGGTAFDYAVRLGGDSHLGTAHHFALHRRF